MTNHPHRPLRRAAAACAKGTALGAALGLTGIVLPVELGKAFANANDVAATCENGLSFSMARGEADTLVTAYLDGLPVRGPLRIVNQGDPLAFTVPSPDKTVPHTWTVVVDSRWNADQTIVRPVPACVAPSTTTSTTLPQSTSSTSVPPPTGTVPSTTVPATASTVVTTPPRTPTTTTSTVPTRRPLIETLPETGGGAPSPITITLASLAVLTGMTLVFRTRRPS